jgi:cytochrome c1
MNPKTTMKAFAAMSDADLGNLVAYMMSLKK